MKKEKLGFSLAEVLITLGIIGIVSALTMPALMTKIRNIQTEAILKENFAILTQMMLSANDNGGLSAPDTSNNIDIFKDWFDTSILPYIKTTRICYDESGCWSNSVKKLNGQKANSYTTGCGLLTISFILPNGSFVCMDDFSDTRLITLFGVNTTSKYSYVFYIDTNGALPPNTIGKDIYLAVFKEETASLVPAGDDMTEQDILRNCSLTGSGYWCLALVKKRGWKIYDIK